MRTSALEQRKSRMEVHAKMAKFADSRGDVVQRQQASDNWLYYATKTEVARAPKYLRWTGRDGKAVK